MGDPFTRTAIFGITACVVTYAAAFGVLHRAKRTRWRIVAEWGWAGAAWFLVWASTITP